MTSNASAKHAPGAPRMPFAVLVCALIGGSLCALLALNTASAANEVRRQNFAVKDASISDSLVQLNNDVNESAAPQNLAAAAAALGMVPAGNPAFLMIGADGKAQVLGSPGAAKAPRLYVPPTAPATSTTPATSTSTTSGTASGKPSTSDTASGKPSNGAHTPTNTPAHTPTNTPTPTPTPTPTMTLPGGPR